MDARPTLLDRRSALPVVGLSELVEACPVVDPRTPVVEVDERFRRDPGLLGVIVFDDAREPALLTRQDLELELTGRFGYGRSLHVRSVVADLVAVDQIVLDTGMTLTKAASRLLQAPAERRRDHVLATGSDGVTGMVGVARLFEHLASSFRDIALHDPLTGLPNRRKLDEHGADLLGAGADLAQLAVLYIDLDGFKQVNDTLGHRAGDSVLVQFAHRLQACTRPDDLVARLGGDEFVVLLVDVSETEVVALADLVLGTTHAAFVIDDKPVRVSASVGLALGREVSPEPALTPIDTLLRQADDAMLHAKSAGRSRVARLQTPGAAAQPARHAAIRRRLREAITERAFTLHYQPQLDLTLHAVRSMEALIRWTDDELGVVPPAEFIAVAERSGQIPSIGRWVIRAACQQARRWLDQGHRWSVAVNISAVQLADGDVAEDILDVLARFRVPTDLFEVEVTESVAVTDMKSATAQLAALVQAGVRVHLDDFGTGYSSLSMLRDLPITALKIDRSIVSRVDTDAAEQFLLAGVVNAAHALGLSVTAEGVERAEQMRVLRTLGVDTAQGYLIARPAPPDDIADCVDRIERPGPSHLPRPRPQSRAAVRERPHGAGIR